MFMPKKINHRPLEYLHKHIEELGFFRIFNLNVFGILRVEKPQELISIMG
jgi:hypothetical protein